MRPLKVSVDPTAPKEHFALSGPELTSRYISGIEGAGAGECPAFIDLVQSCLKSEEWEVSNFISEQYLGHQYPRLSGAVAPTSTTADVQP